jgi:RNA polymerase sigma-70 factor (ECF subfamily)
MQFGWKRASRPFRAWPRTAAAEARMSVSPASPAAPLSSSPADHDASRGDADDRLRIQQLYLEHSRALVRQLTRKTGSRELARDLANETFLRLLRMAPGNVRRIEHPESFLRRISNNLLVDWGRATALRQRSEPTLELASNGELDQVAVLESRDTLRRLEQAMGKLRPRTREIVLAHRVHGFSYAEIADRTGLSIKGVEKQMSKAIANLDRLLDRG